MNRLREGSFTATQPAADRLGSDPILVQHFRHVSQQAQLAEAQPQIAILGKVELSSITADQLIKCSPETSHCRMQPGGPDFPQKQERAVAACGSEGEYV